MKFQSMVLPQLTLFNRPVTNCASFPAGEATFCNDQCETGDDWRQGFWCGELQANLPAGLMTGQWSDEMRVKALDHVNIFTEDLAGTVTFYTELFDLSVRDGPIPLRPDQVQWICDAEDRPILHINTTGAPQAFKRDARPGPTTGAVHHVALNCVGAPDLIARLDARSLTYAVNTIDSIGLKQIFVHDPNGVLLELNFFAG